MPKQFSKDVYLLPGWGTDCRTFFRLDLPGVTLHEMNYIVAGKDDTMADYAKRLIDHYQFKPNSSIIGCSFGGMVGIEIAKQVPVDKLVLISSAKTRSELPSRITRWTGFPIERLPTAGLIRWWVAHHSTIVKKMDERFQRQFKEMVLENDDAFLRKSVHFMVNWQNDVEPSNVLHIHGDRDIVIPIDNIGECETIRRGDHLMLVNRSEEISALVEKFFNQEPLPTYSKSQLALRNGSEKEVIWVAYQGLIYDVTESRLWRDGKHYEHWAGQDLTDELDNDAPHTKEVFERFKVIGKLKG